MIKQFLVSITLLFSIGIFAQSGTSSPYSYYGIGDVIFKGTVENRAMGGVSVFPDSTHVNLTNPASFASLKYTSFALGGTTNVTKFKTNFGEAKAQRSSIDYLALGLPMGKLGVGFGLMPYTSVGYKIRTQADPTSLYTENSGSGGVNRAFLGAGYKITSKLNFGLDMQYNFGQINTSSIEAIPGVQLGSRELTTSNVSGFTFDAALMFNTKIKKTDFFASLVVTPESKLNIGNTATLQTIQKLVNTPDIVIGDPLELEATDITIKLPSKVAFGAGFGETRKWLVGTEVTLSSGGNFSSRFSNIENVKYNDGQKVSIGGYFIPNYNSYTSYFKRIVYRGGLRYEDTGLEVMGKKIDDMAFSLGIGLPLKGTFSNINFGFEAGKRGTAAQNLVRENYMNFSIGLSLNDLWFIKSKYD